jgi:tight adherence protein C
VLLTLALASLLGSVLLIGEAVTLPARDRRTALRRATRRRSGTESVEVARFRERVLAPVAARLAQVALRLAPRTDVEDIRVRLLTAGMRATRPTTFLALKGGAAAGGLLFGLLVGSASGPAFTVLCALGFAFAGFRAPDFVVSSRARRRTEAIRAELPDALDLLGVSVEAGLGFDAAMARLAEHLSGTLVEEFALVLGEMRIGRSRHEALRGLTARVDSPELAAFVRAVVQADQLGMSLGQILRVQAEDSRLRRQASAEEKAMKAPVKMLFPTVLFIFPSMFLVILGPALLNFTRVF